MKRILFFILLIVCFVFLFASCDDASVASNNLSVAADQFKIYRRVVFYNGITDAYILQIEGFCSVEFFTDKFVVTVKTGEKEYKRHYLGRADNVFPFVEQLEASSVSAYHYRVIFKPSVIIPDIDVIK
jgi:hypothetical protein